MPAYIDYETFITANEQDQINLLKNMPNPILKAKDAGGIIVPLTRVAIESGHLETLKFLLDIGIDIETKDYEGCTPLLIAAYYDQFEIACEMAKILLERGADINAKNNNGASALLNAAYKGNVEMVKLLLANGANLQDVELKNGHTALNLAAAWGHTEVVNVLLEKGTDVNHENKHGLVSLIYAIAGNHVNTVKLMLQKGAKVNTGRKLVNPSNVAEERGCSEIINLLKIFSLQKGESPLEKQTCTLEKEVTRRNRVEYLDLANQYKYSIPLFSNRKSSTLKAATNENLNNFIMTNNKIK